VQFPPLVERWRSLVAKHFPPNAVDQMLWVIQHESSGNPSAVNSSSGAAGLAQILPAAHGSGNWTDPETNIAYAAKLYKQSGWKPWGGDGNLYNGKPFGALGFNPFPNSIKYGNTPGPPNAGGGGGGRILPVSGGRTTQLFGRTNEPLDSGGFNKGWDVAVPVGTPVRANISGTVINAGDAGDGWGISVKVRDAQGNIHNFGHLSQANVKVGQSVTAGTQLALSGNTGASTGPHLSYDVKGANGQYIDPSPWLGFNAAGDNRQGVNSDIHLTATGTTGGNSASQAFVGGENLPYQQELEEYMPIHHRWLELDLKVRGYVDTGMHMEFDPEQGLIVAVPDGVDDRPFLDDRGLVENPNYGNTVYREHVALTPEEYQEWSMLSDQLADIEARIDENFGGETVDEAIRRSQFLWEMDPQNIDAANAADRFARELDVREQAATQASDMHAGQMDQLRQAADSQEMFSATRAPGRSTSAPRSSLFIPTPGRIASPEQIFNRELTQLQDAMPEVPDRPYFTGDITPKAGQGFSSADVRGASAQRYVGGISGSVVDSRSGPAPGPPPYQTPLPNGSTHGSMFDPPPPTEKPKQTYEFSPPNPWSTQPKPGPGGTKPGPQELVNGWLPNLTFWR